MNLSTFRDAQNSEPDVTRLFFEFAVGASGAVGAIARQRGFRDTTPFVLGTTGQYTLNLKEGVIGIVGWSIEVVAAAPTTTTNGNNILMQTRTPGGASPLVVIQAVQATGAAAQVASGDSIVGWIDVMNTNA